MVVKGIEEVEGVVNENEVEVGNENLPLVDEMRIIVGGTEAVVATVVEIVGEIVGGIVGERTGGKMREGGGDWNHSVAIVRNLNLSLL